MRVFILNQAVFDFASQKQKSKPGKIRPILIFNFTAMFFASGRRFF